MAIGNSLLIATLVAAPLLARDKPAKPVLVTTSGTLTLNCLNGGEAEQAFPNPVAQKDASSLKFTLDQDPGQFSLQLFALQGESRIFLGEWSAGHLDFEVKGALAALLKDIPLLLLKATPKVSEVVVPMTFALTTSGKGPEPQDKRGPAPDLPVSRQAVKVGHQSFSDRNFWLSIYSGVSYLQSKDDFSKAYPELLLVAERDLLDKGKSKGMFLRVGEEMGLTSTSAVASQASGSGSGGSTTLAESTNPGSRSAVLRARLAFGWMWDLGGQAGKDTTRMSIQAFAEGGVQTLPKGEANLLAGTFNQTFLGLRIQNETGYFSGAYFALGTGRSEQFREAVMADGKPLDPKYVRSRFKADGFLPMTRPGVVRLALRVQADLSRSPFSASWKGLPGDIKISLLAPIDLMRLGTFLKTGATD